MKSTYRPYQDEDDFWRMREFLRRVFLLNGRRERSWHVARLEYARWHSCLNCAKVHLEDVAFLWEEGGQIIAMLMPDGGLGEAQLSVHPILRTLELEEQMLNVAEEHLATVNADGLHKLVVWAPEQDELRQGLLCSRGYIKDSKDNRPEYQWCCHLEAPVVPIAAPPGYTIRSLGDGLELLERCYASGLGFHEGDIRVAVDNRNDPTWYRNIQTAALYRRDLDLVAIAPDGAIAVLLFLVSGMESSPARQAVVTAMIVHQSVSGIVNLVAVLGGSIPSGAGWIGAVLNFMFALAFGYFRFVRPEGA